MLKVEKVEIKRIKAEYREVAKRLTKEIRKHPSDVDELIELREFYRKRVPARVRDIVIDYRIYEGLIRKIRRFAFSETIENHALIVRYSKSGHEGELRLLDLMPIIKRNQAIHTNGWLDEPTLPEAIVV